jgi:FAD/FMN-containing dehydrogenase
LINGSERALPAEREAMDQTIHARMERTFGAMMTGSSGDAAALTPPDEHGLAEILRFASAERVPMAIAGGGTSPRSADSGMPRISLAGLSGVTEVNAGDSVVIARAGTFADTAVREAEKGGLLLPLDPTSGARSTVGGAYMTAVAGPYAAGYGPFRDGVLGARCLTAQGDAVSFGGRTMKNVTGYEITRFLAGTLGLFAVAVELTMKAFPFPERRVVLTGVFDGVDAVGAAFGAVRNGSAVKFYELIADGGLGGGIIVGVGMEGMEPAVARGSAGVRTMFERAGARTVEEMSPDAFTAMRRAASERHVGPGLITVTVPPSASAALLREIRTVLPESPVLAHPLLGRIHIRAAGDGAAAVIRERTMSVGGKIPAVWGVESGDGLAAMFGPGELALARALKRELDPAGILNTHLNLG